MNLEALPNAELRSLCKEKIEGLEHWLRRLIDETLSAKYGDYWSQTASIIKKDLAEAVANRIAKEPTRYPRKIDALLFTDLIDLIHKNYREFSTALKDAFPEGQLEARTFLVRIADARNPLSHANPISIRQAERVICYSNDITDSLKLHYRKLGMKEAYDVPTIIKVKDSFGNEKTREQCNTGGHGGICLQYHEDPKFYLRPGDTLAVEIKIDPSYPQGSYSIEWTEAFKRINPQSGNRIIIPITNSLVGQWLALTARITSNKEWHRCPEYDDYLTISYKVLPPI